MKRRHVVTNERMKEYQNLTVAKFFLTWTTDPTQQTINDTLLSIIKWLTQYPISRSYIAPTIIRNMRLSILVPFEVATDSGQVSVLTQNCQGQDFSNFEKLIILVVQKLNHTLRTWDRWLCVCCQVDKIIFFFVCRTLAFNMRLKK